MTDTSSNKEQSPNKILVKDIDYYIENGLWIFTEKYLSDRGHCCGNKCRHCPYDHIAVNPSSTK